MAKVSQYLYVTGNGKFSVLIERLLAGFLLLSAQSAYHVTPYTHPKLCFPNVLHPIIKDGGYGFSISIRSKETQQHNCKQAFHTAILFLICRGNQSGGFGGEIGVDG
jgi:hypothetical protein